TALAQGRPSRRELEAHALVRVLAVVHEEVDLADAVEQGRKLVLGAPEHQVPPVSQLRRHHPARLLAGWDHRAALAVPERSLLVLLAGDLWKIDRMELARAVVLEREQQERRGDTVAHAGLDRDLRLDC